MALAPATIPTPGIRGRAAAAALAATFAVGLATGLAAPRLAAAIVANQTGVVATSELSFTSAQTERAWLDYRAGERASASLVAWTADQAERAWLDYRAGERALATSP